MLSGRAYPSKLLLFGEYTVLHGTQALAVPFHAWSGRWVMMPHSSPDNPGFISYARWLHREGFMTEDHLDRMLEEHRQGWRYDANIPVGYGLGSSGAYVAAIFSRYLDTGTVTPRVTMARMEAYFHGSSSGMDPLVAWFGKAVYKDEQGEFRLIEDPGWPAGTYVYLLDSQISRSTEPLVKAYNEKRKDQEFVRSVELDLSPMVEFAIHAYLAKATAPLLEAVARISLFQRRHFIPLIPPEIRRRWDTLATDPGVYVKLCGAGGGGFFFVIADHEIRQADLIRVHPNPGHLDT